MKWARPWPIIGFEWLYLGSIAAGIASMLVAGGGMPSMFISTGILLFMGGMIAVRVLLVLLISRKRSQVAKWLLVGLFMFGLLRFGVTIRYAPELLDGPRIDWVIWIMETAAIGLLFTPSARAWMREPRDVIPDRKTLEQTFE